MFKYTRVSIGFGGEEGWGGMNPQKSWAMRGQRNSVNCRHKYVLGPTQTHFSPIH